MKLFCGLFIKALAKCRHYFLALMALFCLMSCNHRIYFTTPVTNNAVAVYNEGTSLLLFSFNGLDSGLQQKDVHHKSWQLNLTSGKIGALPDTPDSVGRLASSASTVANGVFIAGGYSVARDKAERSSASLFEYLPASKQFIKRASLVYPIDDHVQTVWRDSLLYVISGWSDSANVNHVQVYNPAKDQWQLATPLPDELTAKTFGGAGIIVGDTIYYLGGALFDKFYPANKAFYKGYIHPDDPYKITWQRAADFPGAARYRSGVFSYGKQIIFWGGSNETYNYDGISYKEKKPVEPNTTVLIYNITSGTFYEKLVAERLQVMDLRNIVAAKKTNG